MPERTSASDAVGAAAAMARPRSGNACLIEDHVREVVGDTLFMVRPFLDGELMESARVGGAGQEGVPTEEEHEHLQRVAAVAL